MKFVGFGQRTSAEAKRHCDWQRRQQARADRQPRRVQGRVAGLGSALVCGPPDSDQPVARRLRFCWCAVGPHGPAQVVRGWNIKPAVQPSLHPTIRSNRVVVLHFRLRLVTLSPSAVPARAAPTALASSIPLAPSRRSGGSQCSSWNPEPWTWRRPRTAPTPPDSRWTGVPATWGLRTAWRMRYSCGPSDAGVIEGSRRRPDAKPTEGARQRFDFESRSWSCTSGLASDPTKRRVGPRSDHWFGRSPSGKRPREPAFRHC